MQDVRYCKTLEALTMLCMTGPASDIEDPGADHVQSSYKDPRVNRAE